MAANTMLEYPATVAADDTYYELIDRRSWAITLSVFCCLYCLRCLHCLHRLNVLEQRRENFAVFHFYVLACGFVRHTHPVQSITCNLICASHFDQVLIAFTRCKAVPTLSVLYACNYGSMCAV